MRQAGTGRYPPPHPQQQSNKCTVPIDINEELRFFLSPTMSIQIDTPYRIEPRRLQPFLDGTKTVRLIDPRKKKSFAAALHALDYDSLVIDTETSTVFCKRGERLLVVFPIHAQQHYVLQTVIADTYPYRLKVRSQGYPRAHVRRHVQVAAPVTLRAVPAVVVTAIEHIEVRLVREMTLPPGGLYEGGEGYIADMLYEPDLSQHSASMQALEETPAISCGLKDISCGGVGLTVEGDHSPEKLLYRLILLHILLPSVPVGRTHGSTASLALKPLGVIRGVDNTTQPWILHVRFLKQFPKELTSYFEKLECYWRETKSPTGNT